MSHQSFSDHINSPTGQVTITIRDRSGRIIYSYTDPNTVKIGLKRNLVDRLRPSNIWNDAGLTWDAVADANRIDDFAARYITFGASFDNDTGAPLDTDDERFYVTDSSDNVVPLRPNPGADNLGDLINPIPLLEPTRPLKRIEAVRYEASYQPAGTPLLDSSVRATYNTLVLETVLRTDEYNGLGSSSGDFFTLTEVGLLAAPEVDSIGTGGGTPSRYFLDGEGGSHTVPLTADATSTSTVNLDAGLSGPDTARIQAGDEIIIVSNDTTAITDDLPILSQTQPFYLVTEKAGSALSLDRIPRTSAGALIDGEVGIFLVRSRMLAQKILRVPVRKSSDYEITVAWAITFA